jgi:hypothetical protein
MNFGKRILRMWRNVRCVLFGHISDNNICRRCGKMVWLNGKRDERSFQERLNEWGAQFRRRFPRYVGSICVGRGMFLYSFNMASNECKKVSYIEEFEEGRKVIRKKSLYDSRLLYVRAINERMARRKFRRMLFGVKSSQILRQL